MNRVSLKEGYGLNFTGPKDSKIADSDAKKKSRIKIFKNYFYTLINS